MGNSEQEDEKIMQEWEDSLLNMEFIWGVKSINNVDCECSMHTLNDFEIIYFKDTQKYKMALEAFHDFDTEWDAKLYITHIYKQFTKWMTDNNYDTNRELNEIIFLKGFNGFEDIEYESIEDLYATFKFYAECLIGG